MTGQAYKEAGVDIDAAAELVEKIKPAIARTKRSGVMSGIGGFGALFDLKDTGYKDPIIVSATDGVGTKIKIAIDSGIHGTIGIDCVAMCVNDLVVQGAEPLFFLDYFATGKLENNVAANVIEGVAKGCEIAGCALTGGETAEMPGLYADGDYDLAGFSVGAVERENIITSENVKDGDILLGLASSGLHSNGFSLVRKILKDQGLSFNDTSPYDAEKTNAESLLEPTRIYVKSLLSAFEQAPGAVKALSHITGGGFIENLPRSLPEGLGAEVDCASWDLPAVFKWLKQAGNLKIEDLRTTLNCGIGMVVICDAGDKDALVKIFEEQGETVYEMGRVISDENKTITLKNAEQAWG